MLTLANPPNYFPILVVGNVPGSRETALSIWVEWRKKELEIYFWKPGRNVFFWRQTEKVGRRLDELTGDQSEAFTRNPLCSYCIFNFIFIYLFFSFSYFFFFFTIFDRWTEIKLYVFDPFFFFLNLTDGFVCQNPFQRDGGGAWHEVGGSRQRHAKDDNYQQ